MLLSFWHYLQRLSVLLLLLLRPPGQELTKDSSQPAPAVMPDWTQLPAAVRDATEFEPEVLEGLGGYRQSPLFQQFVDFARHNQRKELFSLAKHGSAIVRLYAAHYIATELSEDAMVVYPLLYDESAVTIRGGCTSWEEKVSTRAVAILCQQVVRSGVEEVLRQAARDAIGTANGLIPAAVAARALVCISTLRRPDDSRLAFAFLKSADITRRAGGLAALGGMNLKESYDVLAAHSSAPASAVRASVVAGLGKLFDDRAAALLATMTRDRDPVIRSLAASTFARHPRAELTTLRQMLWNQDESLRTAAAHAVANDVQRVGLTLLAEYLSGHPKELSNYFYQIADKRSPAITEFVQTLAVDPAISRSDRERLLDYLNSHE